jgi:hypothetical protein
MRLTKRHLSKADIGHSPFRLWTYKTKIFWLATKQTSVRYAANGGF